MQENLADAFAFFVMLVLPIGIWTATRPPVWRRLSAWLGPVGIRLWAQLVQPEEPDEELLHRYALVRLELLQTHLARVRRLVADDEWMTATRQTANRIAHDHLVHDVREAEDKVLAFGPIEVPAPPTPVSAPRFAFSSSPQPAVELIEFGPSGRWL